MPIYIYTAKTKKGETKEGKIEASDRKQAADNIRSKGLILLSIEAENKKEKQSFKTHLLILLSKIKIIGNVSLVDKMIFSQHLAVMIESGLSLNQALKALQEQTRNPRFGKIIGQIEADVRQGESFSNALKKYKKVFGELYVNMVKVGEASGNLNEVLKILASQMKKDHELISRIKGAMTYPAVIIVAMIGIGILMMVMVVPKITQVFTELEIDLPLSTRIVIGTSNFLKEHSITALGLFVAYIFFIRYLSRISIIKKILHRFYLHLPIFGPLIRKVNSARFSRTLSSLLNGGIAIVEALKITSGTLGNIHFKKSLLASASQVQKGETLSKSLGKFKNIYLPMVTQMVKTGEETGNLSEILENLADFYEEEIDNTTKSLSSIIEPVIMIIIGAAVGFFAVSMLQPMYSMMGGL